VPPPLRRRSRPEPPPSHPNRRRVAFLTDYPSPAERGHLVTAGRRRTGLPATSLTKPSQHQPDSILPIGIALEVLLPQNSGSRFMVTGSPPRVAEIHTRAEFGWIRSWARGKVSFNTDIGLMPARPQAANSRIKCLTPDLVADDAPEAAELVELSFPIRPTCSTPHWPRTNVSCHTLHDSGASRGDQNQETAGTSTALRWS
jgi:hypothetical protein